MKYIRTCQECGHKQEARDPSTFKGGKPTEAWRGHQCKRCHSSALNYGSHQLSTPQEFADRDAEEAAQEAEYQRSVRKHAGVTRGEDSMQ